MVADVEGSNGENQWWMCRLRPPKQHISGPPRSNGEGRWVNPLKSGEFIPNLGMFLFPSVDVRFEEARGL
ncbi:hypothetical protein V6N12_044145 [Hibiscus sabdariffa]|uniref:Uncharacterized protein n=1 Tax=Hibiscus sabdariffa TaxID=183260 RepID=A0ABR2DGE3_9ROSI